MNKKEEINKLKKEIKSLHWKHDNLNERLVLMNNLLNVALDKIKKLEEKR